MLRALGPWGILIVVTTIGMCIWRFEGRRAASLDAVEDGRAPLAGDDDPDDLAYEYNEDDEPFVADTAIMANDHLPPIGPDDSPEFIETLERFVRPSE